MKIELLESEMNICELMRNIRNLLINMEII